MTAREIRKRLVGRTITAARARAFPSGRTTLTGAPKWAHNWTLTLDDGTHVTFEVEETEREHGVDIFLYKP